MYNFHVKFISPLSVFALIGMVSVQFAATASPKAKSTAQHGAAEPTVCAALHKSYEGASKRIAVSWALHSNDENSILAQARITLDLLKANNCKMPTEAPSGQPYAVQALRCINDSRILASETRGRSVTIPTTCDRDQWKPYQVLDVPPQPKVHPIVPLSDSIFWVSQTPKAGVEATITTGSQMLESRNISVNKLFRLRLRDNFEISLGIQGRMRVPRDELLEITSVDPIRACTVNQVGHSDFLGVTDSACFRDDDQDGYFEKTAAKSALFTSRTIKPPVPYELVDATRYPQDFIRVSLTYANSNAGTLSLIYSEFSGNNTQPTYTGTLSLPLGEIYPQTVSWRGATFTLLGLSSKGLRYRVEGGR